MGTPARTSAQMWMSTPCDEVQLVLPKEERTSKRVLRTLDIQCLQQVVMRCPPTKGWMKHVPNGREERETAREWDPEPMNEEQCQQRAKTARDWDPRTCEQKKSSANSGRERDTVLRVRKPTTSGITSKPGQVERDHQHEPEGKLSQSEAENFRDEDEANQSKIETVWFGYSETIVRDPCVLFNDKLSRRDNKGLNNQDGEVLTPINKQCQNNR